MYQHKRRWALWVALCLCLSLALPTLATAERVPEATPPPRPPRRRRLRRRPSPPPLQSPPPLRPQPRPCGKIGWRPNRSR